jgi:integrase
MRQILDKGIDPSLDRQEKLLIKKAEHEDSFQAIATKWHETWKSDKSPQHQQAVWNRLEYDLFPFLGKNPINEITAPQILMVVKKIEARGASDIAKRTYQTCGQVFRYAVAHGLCERNPAKDIKPSDALKPRQEKNFARVDEKEFPELLRKIDDYTNQGGTEIVQLAIKLMSYTFVRTSELIGARWSEIDLEAKQWRIPAERMKMKDPHIVALSKQSIEILKRLHEISGGRELVFPSNASPLKSMSNNTILFALYRMGYHSRMTGHGFRGIASTILHEQGYPHEHIELQLAHQERNKVSASYNHAKYLPQRAKMMQHWSDYLDGIKSGAKVINLKKA